MEANRDKGPAGLPACAVEYIDRVVREIRWRKRVRAEVHEELTAHFEDDLRDCADAAQREARARELIEQFGDAKLLAALCRRAKKRCRPLWQKALLRTGQGILVVLAYTVLCSLPLFLGRPTIRVNYVEWLNEHWRPADTEAGNAATYYEQAAKLYVKAPQRLWRKVETSRPELEDYNDVELGLLAAWLDENAPALAKFRQGANTPDYWPIYDTNESSLRDPNFMSTAMDALTVYRHLTFVLIHKAAYEVHRGNVQDAFDDCFVIRRVGRHLQGRGLLIEQLVGVAIESVAYSRMFHILYDQTNVPRPVLEHARNQLRDLHDEDRSVVSFDGEKALWYDNIQRTFTDDGAGGGHALRQGFTFAAGNWLDNLLGVFVFDYPDRRETMAMVEQFFERAQSSLQPPPGEEGPSLVSDEEEGIPFGNMRLSILPPAFEQVDRQTWALKTHEAATIVAVAILSCKSDKGEYPASLDELVEMGYLSKLPQDPYANGPLSYRRTDDGFLLYSWGDNLTDDGGVQGLRQGGQPGLWADNGDWVFWPVAGPANRR
ncbi:MAG: hypothetical protein RBR19_00045 [Sedimentisphaerales bacterium]|jgi:hypothetical protein|nr:hypothetical protein [Sedimentisphaerales bacterium]NLT75063.1 hypothetical protein [Planctomycetota bacterium]